MAARGVAIGDAEVRPRVAADDRERLLQEILVVAARVVDAQPEWSGSAAGGEEMGEERGCVRAWEALLPVLQTGHSVKGLAAPCNPASSRSCNSPAMYFSPR